MADSKSHANSEPRQHSVLSAPMGVIIGSILKYNYLILFLMIAGAVSAGLYTMEHLSFKNRRLDLINPKSEWNQYWLEYISKFGSEDDLIIVVDGDSAEKIIPALNATAAEIEKKPNLFHSLFYKFDDTALLSKALYFASEEELQDLNLFLKCHEDVFQGNWDTLSIDRILPQTVMPLAAEPGQIPPRMVANMRQALERMIFSLEQALGPTYQFCSPFPEIDLSKGRDGGKLPTTSRPEASNKNRSMLNGFNSAWNGTQSSISDSTVTMASLEPQENLVHYIANYPGSEFWVVNYAPDVTDPYVPCSETATQTSNYYPMESANGGNFQDVSELNPQLYAMRSPFDSHENLEPGLPSPEGEMQMEPANPYYGSNLAEIPASAESDQATFASVNEIENETVEASLNRSPQSGESDPVSAPIKRADHDSHIHYTWLTPNKTAVMMVKMREEKNADFARGTAGIETLRSILASIQEKHPGVTLQLTGLPVMENDEMRSSQNAMNWATWLSVLGVALLYIYFFRELRHPILAIIALFVGIGWSMAYITFFIGHLNILSMAFAVILIGLGIDFGIHYTSRYLTCRAEGNDTKTALIHTGKEIGPGILTGALTTAAAFFMAGMTEFTGIAELGIIAGGGVLCCCLAALTVLPILIYMVDKNRPQEKFKMPRSMVLFQGNPKVVFFLSVLIIGAVACGLPKLYYDYNLLNLQPKGLESVALEMRLIEESKQSCWFAISMSDNEEVLRDRIEKFSVLPSVDHVEQLVTLISDENPLVRQIHEVLTKTPSDVHQSPVLTKEDARKLYQCLEMARLCLTGKAEFLSYYERIEALQKQLLGMRLTEYFARMTQYQESLARDLLAKLNKLEKMSSPEPPTLSDLPKAYVDRMRAEDGTYLLKIYAKGDLWDMDNLEKFVKEVRSVDPKVTGNPLQTYECSLQMKKGYQDAAIYALGIVFLLLMLDLRSLADTFFAMLPVLLGIICTFGIMGYFNIPLNAANLIVLPLILGIGIDDGVHIMHDFHNSYNGGVYRISSSTSMSVILTSLTTILSFGTLMLAEHRGLQSLGMVLAIGTTCCWLTSLLVLPAMLNLFFSHGNQPISQNANPVPRPELRTVPCEDSWSGRQNSESSYARENANHHDVLAFTPFIDDEFVFPPRRSATCYTRNADGEIVNSTGKAA
ncbi:MAG: MMPL family transporter [Thermoguttaceae bacterium]|nr:MMPL family transporter [Thermoguttaceae bacterium]